MTRPAKYWDTLHDVHELPSYLLTTMMQNSPKAPLRIKSIVFSLMLNCNGTYAVQIRSLCNSNAALPSGLLSLDLLHQPQGTSLLKMAVARGRSVCLSVTAEQTIPINHHSTPDSTTSLSKVPTEVPNTPGGLPGHQEQPPTRLSGSPEHASTPVVALAKWHTQQRRLMARGQ